MSRTRFARAAKEQLLLLLLFSHDADWAALQPRLWFAEQGKTEGTQSRTTSNNIEQSNDRGGRGCNKYVPD